MDAAHKKPLTLLYRCLAVLAFFATPSALFAQSCAMCYQSAAASGPRTIEALRHGILIMLFPPLLIFAGIMVLAHRRSQETLEAEAATSGEILLPLEDFDS